MATAWLRIFLFMLLRFVSSPVESSLVRLSCADGEYEHSGRCCKSCRPGTYVSKHCSTPHTPGICFSCADGEDYTAHANGLEECLACRQCKDDQIIARACTVTCNTKCQCKLGYFC
uniref:TNFR-Cys domain-containing protein n=1 Tax=Sphenodon punctatus TaxID=8508 RepID=A0A8D0GCC6_SPHPU